MAPTRVLILHAYSAENAGDGLLVRETLALVNEAIPDAEVTLLASRPETFVDLQVTCYPTAPTLRGWDARTRRVLRGISRFDVVVGVGGGYLRAGTFLEAAKTALVHGPQLLAASRSQTSTIYLPQSIGPARFGSGALVRSLLRRVDEVYLRDDRSVREVGGPTTHRVPDLATAAVAGGRRPGTDVEATPVLSIRAVRGKVSPALYTLAEDLGTYDGYVQSTTGGNDDRPASATLRPNRTIPRHELMSEQSAPRVVVAVRLHAALMALAAGHYVVHLAYERKGFGAFQDLGLQTWVHSVNRFDPALVASQVRGLLQDPNQRAVYDDNIAASAATMSGARAYLVERLRERANFAHDTEDQAL